MPRTFLSANWQNLIMANYAVDPELLKPYLPKGTELDFFEGNIYVSLVGFMFKKTSIFNIPIPFLGTFEEINLRFYVKRIEGNNTKRGVVFINETVPYQTVAWLANKLYKEHYIAIPTKNKLEITPTLEQVEYQWKINNQWNHLMVKTAKENQQMKQNSVEEFIFEHYYGYTKISNQLSQEYKINHQKWQIKNVLEYNIHCDFNSMYGKDFSFLTDTQPNSVMMAQGSDVTVNWKRTKF
jgi:uncharacterized protein